MTNSVTTLEDVDQKLKAAEERRKKAEEEKLSKLEQADKHAQEVRQEHLVIIRLRFYLLFLLTRSARRRKS